MDIKLFFKENIKTQTHKLAVSQRIKDAKDQPIEWTIRPINGDELEQLRMDCTEKIRNKKTGKLESRLNQELLSKKLLVSAIVEPNPKDEQLLQNYKVVSPEDVLGKMLLFGELTHLTLFVNEISGFDVDLDDVVDDLKN